MIILINLPSLLDYFLDWTFSASFLVYIFSIEEMYQWAKNGKRSELSDLVAILLGFLIILFLTKNFLTSLIGAFSLYLWFGVYELKEYPIINKLVLISLVTYNIMFIAGLISSILNNPYILNTTFAFSFWILLGLGFIFFGRKYLVVWRFISPQYLSLFLYIIGWLIVVFIDQYTPLDFVGYIYYILIIMNFLIYFSSGPILDKMLGIKRIDNGFIIDIVNQVKDDMGIKTNVKVGFGKYPILNAMAYGAFFDRRIAVIADDLNTIPTDELKGIIAHELAHSKGNHTLILAFLTATDLLIRMLFGFPATYYDYTFGNPSIPLIWFIIINILIFSILYVIVRILEGKADKKTKKVGYKIELVKALYNLESFYASGREIGLNTMLLCDEKIKKYNKELDYVRTAKYLNSALIKPSRLSLLSNLLNSHPPTYYRITAILGENINPSKGALLPFINLKKSNQRKFAEQHFDQRAQLKDIINQKFIEKFSIKNISSFFAKIDILENYQHLLHQNFIIKDKITDEVFFGNIVDIQINNDLSEEIEFIVKNDKNDLNINFKESDVEIFQLDLQGIYPNKDGKSLLLNSVITDENGKVQKLQFKSVISDKIINLTIEDFKFPIPYTRFKEFKNKIIFLKSKNKLQIYHFENFHTNDNLRNSVITLSEHNNRDNKVDLELNEIIFFPHSIQYAIMKNAYKNQKNRELFAFLKDQNIKTHIYLKKPVNNLEIGYILNFTYKNENSDRNESFMEVLNIFGKHIIIPIKSIEFITFKYSTGTIQLKSEISLFSKLGYLFLKKMKPNKIFYQ